MENSMKRELIELGVNRLRANHLGEIGKEAYYTSMIANILRQDIDLQKKLVNKECGYKGYIEANKEKIKSICGLNVIVEDHDEAVKVIRQQDFRKILNLDYNFKESFESNIFLVVEAVEGLCNSEEEVNFEVHNELEALDKGKKEVINVSIDQAENKIWTYSIYYKIRNRQVYIYLVNNEYKLFFFRGFNNKEVIEESYDIINLFEIIYNTNTYTAINLLCDLLNIKIQYVEEQRLKYSFNRTLIQNRELLKSMYLPLYKYTYKHIYLLEQLLEEGEKNITTNKNSFNEENIFFCSGEYIEDKLMFLKEHDKKIKPIKQNQICKLVNAFCALGFLIKVGKENVPQRLRKVVEGKKEINYYIVPKYTDELLLQAEARVRILKYSGRSVSATAMTEENCREKFGDNLCEMIYGTYTKENKSEFNEVDTKVST